MNDSNKERLGKIVALARNGIGGEKENAVKMVKSLCKKYHLIFEEVMSESAQIMEYTISYTTQAELDVLVQVIGKYADLNDSKNSSYNKYRKVAIFKTTKEKYIETVNAWSVLRVLYRKERSLATKALFYGFLDKHDLYYHPTPEEFKKRKKNEEQEDPEELKARAMGLGLSRHLEDANIHKQLKGK